jgi:hypothetical protein
MAMPGSSRDNDVMRIDVYTKAVLTIIAVMLAVIALQPFIHPQTTAHAAGAFAGLQFIGDAFFDTRTGDVWWYNTDSGTVSDHFRMTKPGQPLVRPK